MERTIVSEHKLFGRINPEACVVNFEEIYKRLGKGPLFLYIPARLENWPYTKYVSIS